ncbi:acetyltransferase [Alicyclobacillaceae bacterium I2511]|nr:acetyltransferase [Alicyclobacillaceae bacterium I2511]
MPEPVKGNGRYMPGLDGLRALAVLAVIAYHLHVSWAPGGLLGVGVFFVLSGYLITDLLLAQWERHQRLNLKDFWLRRARRLLPALWVMLVGVVVWATLWSPSLLSSLRGDVLAAFFYVSNWWYIFHHVSYFARFGPPSPLGHLWSLAVEEQFYLFWPLGLTFFLRRSSRKGPLLAWTLVLATASALAMALLYQPGGDPNRVYYGTDTRAFSLLIGAALAIVWPSRKLTSHVTWSMRWTLDVVGFAGVTAILLLIGGTNQYQTSLYRGGMVLLSVAAALAVASLAHPASDVGKVLGCKPLKWLGMRSYGIYLWHYPVIVLTTPIMDVESFNGTRAALQVAASIALAALSWRYVEDPIRHGALSRYMNPQFSQRRRKFTTRVSQLLISGGGLLALIVAGIGLSGLVQAKGFSDAAAVASLGSTQVAADVPKKTTTGGNGDVKSGLFLNHPAPLQSSPSPTVLGSGTPHGTGVAPSSNPPSSVPAAVISESGQGVTAIGDSVMIDAAPYLKKLLPGIVVDAHIGRQVVQAQAVVTQLKAKGLLGNRVIIELGTNGPFTEQQMVSLLQSLGSVQQIVLVNTRMPRPWQDTVNQTLAQVAAIFPKVTLVNWYDASAGKGSYFYPDGVHLDPTGAQYYASLLAKAVETQKLSS